MPHKKTPAKKPIAKKASSNRVEPKPRKLERPDYSSFRLAKRIAHPGPRLSGAFSLFKSSVKHILAHKKLFAGITLVYLLLSLILVRGFVFTGDLSAAKEALTEVFEGASGQITASFTILGVLLGTNGPASEVASAYQGMVVVIVSLALIWALRQTHAKEKITTKDAFYKSMYPLVPFVLVLLVIGLQLLPLLAGSFLYGATVGSGLATTMLEQILWVVLAFLLALWAIYMVTSSIFALYIVTLPDMTPLKALRSAKGLVHLRRWTIMRKVLFLPFMTCVVGILVMLPVIMFLTPIAEIVFLLLSTAALALVHSYMYSLYRELL